MLKPVIPERKIIFQSVKDLGISLFRIQTIAHKIKAENPKRKAAKESGGKFRKPILIKSHVDHQIKQRVNHTRIFLFIYSERLEGGTGPSDLVRNRTTSGSELLADLALAQQLK